ncbi:hypothetical protein BTW08_05420 [Salinicola sp. MH3R3-1]|uniref:hypothetical protein n=1 Tax=Salinicola sp. MH3R3-1 TaxID=1928762 RepID=UPI00094E1DB6|nr:hypothetical protein [Salinicola sp. MH3R3-1]OLO08757.1 hypothetical protein BTW08_05420 [Salinicola sp. MH3R3-1]
MPKYEYAQRRRDDGTIERIYPRDLHDAGTRATARASELWDEHFEVRVFPRYRTDAPHFYSLGKRRYIDERVESDPSHDKRVEELLARLKGNEYKIGFYEKDGEEKQFVTVAKPSNYLWDSEVTRSLTRSVRCRHDIFGEAEGRNLTAGFPWVAIEVVNTHYPDEKTLEAFLALSEQLPFVVLFDLVAVPNYFFKIDEKRQEIRTIYYVYDGSVWKNGNRWKRCSAQFLREKLEEHKNYVISRRS